MDRFVLAFALAVVLALPASSEAQSCEAPPGTAAIDQYCETVPDVEGVRGAGEPAPAAPVAQDTLDELAASGADGEAFAQSLGDGLGDGPGSGSSPEGISDGNDRTAPTTSSSGMPDAPSNNPLTAVSQAVGDGSTVGLGLIVVIIAATIAIMGWAWLAYRRRITPGD